jgi:hypothetical protein
VRSDLIEAFRDRYPAWYADPVEMVLESYPTDPEGKPTHLDDKQREILRAVAKYDRVVVRSSHGIGKTTAAALVAQWFVSTRYPALVVTLAGVWAHLEDKLWPQIRMWGRRWRLRDVFTWKVLSVELAEPGPEETQDTLRIKPSSSDRPENIEGWHSPNLLIIVDEAKAMPDEVYDAIRGALTNAEREGKVKMLVLSTPPLANVGWYCRLFGVRSEGWHRIHVSGLDSERVSQHYIDEMARDYGADSAVYQAKVLGNIPEAGADVVIQGRWIEDAQQRGENPGDKRRPVVICDVARQGEDLTAVGVIHKCKHRITRWEATTDLMEVVGMCGTAVRELEAAVLVVDDSGLGGGVTDRIRELRAQGEFPKDCLVVPIQFGASAVRDDRFANMKSEMWWALREVFRQGLLAIQTDHELAALQLPRGNSLVAQLSGAIYEEDSRSRLWVFDHRASADTGTSAGAARRERLKALPTKSPDLAHTIIMGIRAWLRLPQILRPEPRTVKEAFDRNIHDSIRRRMAAASRRAETAEEGDIPGF